MKKTIIIVLLGIIATTANAQFLFKIKGGGLEKPSYILGSIHTLDGSILDSIPEYLKAEAECEQIYFEYDISDQQKINEMKNAGKQATTLPEGKTIFDVLSKEQTDILNTRFNETFHVNLTDSLMKTTWNYQPFVFLTTFSLIFATEEMSKHPELGMVGTPMDLVCIERAKERGMTLGQLDQIQSQDSLAKMRDKWMENMDTQVDSLMSFLNNFEQRRQQVIDEITNTMQVAEYWKKGDYNSFKTDSKWLSEIDKAPTLFQNRNEKWLPMITSAMHEAPTLVVFGSGHLIGEFGIINLLHKAGYEIEQIDMNHGISDDG